MFNLPQRKTLGNQPGLPSGRKYCPSRAMIFYSKVHESTTCYKTRKISFYQGIIAEEPKKEFALSAQTWTGLILFLAKVCPNLSQLQCKVNAHFLTKASENDLVDGLTNLVETIQGMLIKLAVGSPQLSIRLKLRLYLEVDNYQELPFESHELFRLGTALTLKNFLDNIGTRRFRGREIKVADKLGREHELLFNIFEGHFPNKLNLMVRLT